MEIIAKWIYPAWMAASLITAAVIMIIEWNKNRKGR